MLIVSSIFVSSISHICYQPSHVLIISCTFLPVSFTYVFPFYLFDIYLLSCVYIISFVLHYQGISLYHNFRYALFVYNVPLVKSWDTLTNYYLITFLLLWYTYFSFNVLLSLIILLCLSIIDHNSFGLYLHFFGWLVGVTLTVYFPAFKINLICKIRKRTGTVKIILHLSFFHSDILNFPVSAQFCKFSYNI